MYQEDMRRVEVMCIYCTSSDITVYAVVSTGFDHSAKPGLNTVYYIVSNAYSLLHLEICKSTPFFGTHRPYFLCFSCSPLAFVTLGLRSDGGDPPTDPLVEGLGFFGDTKLEGKALRLRLSRPDSTNFSSHSATAGSHTSGSCVCGRHNL